MAKRTFNSKPQAVRTHPTLKPAGGKQYKGTYYRRLEDIGRALKTVDDAKTMKGGQFLYLYYGCEKLGRGIVGIAGEWDAEDAYDERRGLVLPALKAAVIGRGDYHWHHEPCWYAVRGKGHYSTAS